jgi:hypothetical protein
MNKPIKHRAPSKREGGLSDTIGFRAPKETREKLDRVSRLLNYSCNLVVIEAVNAIHDMIYTGPTHTPAIVLRGRAYKDIA